MLSKKWNEELVDLTIFKQMVGYLGYLRYLCIIRPYIAYSVGMLSRYMEESRTPHYLTTKKILIYIIKTSELGLLYPWYSIEDETGLTGFTGADWRGDKDDRKNTTSYVFMMNDTSISWCSKKQNIIA